MTKIWWNTKNNKLYSWKSSKNCVNMDTENKIDCLILIQAGAMKESGD